MENDQTQPLTSQLPPVATPTIQPISQKLSQLPVVLLSLLSFIFLSGMAYFYLQTQSLKEQLTTQQSPISASTNPSASQLSPPTNSTSEWKTYTNPGFGFSFRYPPNASITKDNIDNREIIFNKFAIYIDQSTSSIKDYVSLLRDTNSIAPTYNIYGSDSAEWIGSFKNAPAHYVSIKNKQNIYSVLISPTENMTKFEQVESDLLIQIISTFKFTN